MILVDSSAWIEYFTNGSLTSQIHRHITSSESILVPTVVIFEVYRKISRVVSQDEGLSAIASLSSYQIVDMTRDIALTAADLSIEYKIGMADSIVLATAQEYRAALITLDHDFHRIPGVKILKRT